MQSGADRNAGSNGRQADWSVYIVRCSDGTLYTGVARDVLRRVRAHNGSDSRAAKYTRTRRPVALVYQEAAASRSEAMRRELEIKRMSRAQKEVLICAYGAACRDG